MHKIYYFKTVNTWVVRLIAPRPLNKCTVCLYVQTLLVICGMKETIVTIYTDHLRCRSTNPGDRWKLWRFPPRQHSLGHVHNRQTDSQREFAKGVLYSGRQWVGQIQILYLHRLMFSDYFFFLLALSCFSPWNITKVHSYKTKMSSYFFSQICSVPGDHHPIPPQWAPGERRHPSQTSLPIESYRGKVMCRTMQRPAERPVAVSH